MPFAVQNALAPAPRPAPERADPPSDEREFARALEEREEVDESRDAERADSAPTKAPAEPAAESAAGGAASPLAVAQTALAALLAPAPSPPAATQDDAQPAPALVPQGAPESTEKGGPEAVVDPAPSEQATEPTTVSQPELAANAGQAALEAQRRPAGEAIEAKVDGDAEPDSDQAWTPPGPSKPVVGAAKPGVQPAAAAQVAFAEGERLAQVRVLRQAAAEAPASEAKPGVAQAASANANASSAAPAGAAPAASFEAKLQAADPTAAAPSAPPRHAAPPPPAAQVAVHVARAFEDGVRRLEVKLHPAELGRVEVKLDVGQDGRVLAVVAADRQDTLDLLQRDARGLERALQDAGIRADSGSLSFTLRQQERDAWPGSGRNASGPGYGDGVAGSAVEPVAAVRPRANLRALDISV